MSLFRPLLMVLLLAGPAGGSAAQAQDRGNLDVVLIVDLSKSMRGVGGTANIFGRVQETGKELIRALRPGDTVTLIPFADAARALPTITLYGAAERDRLFAMIDELEAEGNWTYTAAALQLALEEAARLEGALPAHRRIVFVLTDGLNEPPPGARADSLSLDAIARPYAGKPWYVYQVQYGAEVDEDLAGVIAAAFPQGGTITDRDAQGGIDKLRPVIERPAPPEPPATEALTWEAEPDRLVLDLAEAGVPIEATLRLQWPQDLSLSAVEVTWQKDEVPASIDLSHEWIQQPGGETLLRVTAQAGERLDNAMYDAQLRLNLLPGVAAYTAAPLDVPVALRTAMVPPVWPYWVGGIIGLLFLVGLVGWAWSAARKQRLFGKLEYWPTASPGQVRTLADDLVDFGRKAVLGSDDLPVEGSSAPLADLTVTKVDDQRLVTVTTRERVRLRYDGRRASRQPLYDRDTFELNDWTFRYGSNGVVGRRPRERSRR